jgi:excisionase family DNA binding protein
MTHPIASPLQHLAAAWEEESGRRLRVTKTDPAAEALAFCASELRVTLREALAAAHWLSVEQTAARLGVQPVTIRKWIKRGELAAESTPHGYRVAADATRKVRAA